MAYSHIYIIPKTGPYNGGELWDKYGNLEFFANVDSLEDKVKDGGTDNELSIKAHKRLPYINSKVEISVPAHSRFVVTGVNQPKGARPGYTVTLQGGEEKRQFQYTGTLSCLYSWLKTTAKVQVTLYGPSGSPKDPIAAVTDSGFSQPT